MISLSRLKAMTRNRLNKSELDLEESLSDGEWWLMSDVAAGGGLSRESRVGH